MEYEKLSDQALREELSKIRTEIKQRDIKRAPKRRAVIERAVRQLGRGNSRGVGIKANVRDQLQDMWDVYDELISGVAGAKQSVVIFVSPCDSGGVSTGVSILDKKGELTLPVVGHSFINSLEVFNDTQRQKIAHIINGLPDE
jgi:hypothetical protein